MRPPAIPADGARKEALRPIGVRGTKLRLHAPYRAETNTPQALGQAGRYNATG